MELSNFVPAAVLAIIGAAIVPSKDNLIEGVLYGNVD